MHLTIFNISLKNIIINNFTSTSTSPQVVTIEDELSAIGENQKQLEVSEEKARRREEKYQVLILNNFG